MLISIFKFIMIVITIVSHLWCFVIFYLCLIIYVKWLIIRIKYEINLPNERSVRYYYYKINEKSRFS